MIVASSRDDVLLEAVFDREWDSSRELLNGSNAPSLVRYRNEVGESALHFACLYDAPLDVVESLCRHYRSDEDESGINDISCNDLVEISTPLHSACAYADEEVVSLLLTTFPQDTAQPDPLTGALPLHNAVDYRRGPTVVRKLLSVHPTAVHAATYDDEYDTPLRRLTNKFRRNEFDLRRLSGHTNVAVYSADNDLVVTNNERTNENDKLLREMLLLLLTAHVYGTIEVDKRREHLLLPLHEVIRLRLDVDVRLIRALDRSECARHDDSRNFPLHLACALLPF